MASSVDNQEKAKEFWTKKKGVEVARDEEKLQ
jgi:hypothetical protein